MTIISATPEKEINTHLKTFQTAKKSDKKLISAMGIRFNSNDAPKEVKKSALEDSKDAFRRAARIGKTHAALSCLLTDMKNPEIPNEALFAKFQKIASSKLMTLIEQNLALSFPEEKAPPLKNHFRRLLQLRNSAGISPLESYLDYLSNKLTAARDLGHLYYLDSLISQNSKVPQVHEMTETFHQLSPKCQKGIVFFYKQHLTSPSKTAEILEHIALSPDSLKTHFTRTSALENAVRQTQTNLICSFSYTLAYTHTEQFQEKDDQQIATDVLKLHQLQDFYVQLIHMSSSVQKKVIFEKFLMLDSDLKTVIGKALWIACYKPPEAFFTDRLLKENPYILLDCVNKQGLDIIAQLIDHYQSRINVQRSLPAFDAFKEVLRNNLNNEEMLEHFNALPPSIKADLQESIWLDHGGKTDPQFGHPSYGEETINKDVSVLTKGAPSAVETYHKLLEERVDYSILQGVDQFEEQVQVPQDPVDCSAAVQLADPTLADEIPKDMRIAMVTAEFSNVISIGGLAPAVQGMAKSYGVDKTRVILPKYDVIDPKISLKEKPKYQIALNDKIHKVFKANVGGIKCYFIEDNEVFNVGRNNKGEPNNIYETTSSSNPDASVKRRWAHFNSHAADLVEKFSKKEKNPVSLVHLHDAQTALVPKILKTRHFDAWKEGETPAVVFTFHNNNAPLHYNYAETQESLKEIGLPPDPLCAFIDGLENADAVTTVSEQFAKEAQTDLYGKQMERYVKITASKGKLIGIVNGNTSSWNPKTDAQLKSWKTRNGDTLDLTYGPDDTDLAQKTIAIRRELTAYLSHHQLGHFDPTKPIFLYVGRYDSYQKGIGKLPLIMKEAIENGAQFICIGVEPDRDAITFLEEMEAFAQLRNYQGVAVIRDYKRPDGRLYWQQGNLASDTNGVQGFGSLLRAGIDVGIFPSSFEPCGLVQLELLAMGIPPAATATGGFVNTIFPSGPNKNGYLFARSPDWQSEQQNHDIRQTIKIAAQESQEKLNGLYSSNSESQEQSIAQKRVMMRNAANSTWESTFDGSMSPIERLKRAYALAIRAKQTRGLIPLDLHTLHIA